jgi:CheY-like chemotaxis protein
VVRRATPSVFSPKLGVFTTREERARSSNHGVQPGQDGLALLLAMPDQSPSALPSGPELAPETDGRDHSSNHARLVLLIDDDEVVVRLLERALSAENYRSLTVSAGGLDLSVLEERPFAIVVDITVPDVDGFEIVPRLRQHPLAQGVPIVMMSTRSGLKDRRSERGLQNFLTKPFRPSQLLQMLRKFAKDAESDQGS